MQEVFAFQDDATTQWVKLNIEFMDLDDEGYLDKTQFLHVVAWYERYQ